MKWNNKHTPQKLLVFPEEEKKIITYTTPLEKVTIEIGSKERIIKTAFHMQGVEVYQA
jgi:hypothetical protein